MFGEECASELGDGLVALIMETDPLVFLIKELVLLCEVPIFIFDFAELVVELSVFILIGGVELGRQILRETALQLE